MRSEASCSPQAARSWCAAAARTRLMAMSRWRQSTSSAPTLSATSRARSRRSRSIPSGSLGAPVMASRTRSSSMPRSRRSTSARFGTVKKARSWCALVSFWLTLRAMSSASVRTCRSSVDSMTGPDSMDHPIPARMGQFLGRTMRRPVPGPGRFGAEADAARPERGISPFPVSPCPVFVQQVIDRTSALDDSRTSGSPRRSRDRPHRRSGTRESRCESRCGSPASATGGPRSSARSGARSTPTPAGTASSSREGRDEDAYLVARAPNPLRLGVRPGVRGALRGRLPARLHRRAHHHPRAEADR